MSQNLFFLSIITILFASCNYYADEDPIKPNSTGKAGEIIVVIEDNLWKGKVGDTIYYGLSQPFDVLPQDEPFFDVVHIPHDAFKNFFKTHRNLIFVRVGPSHEENKLTVEKNKWSNSQLIYHFYAPNDTAFISLWEDSVAYVMQNILDTEMERYKRAYAKFQNDEAKRKVAENFNISLSIAQEYNIDVEEEHFFWISRETEVSSQGIFIYDYPYTDSNTFTVDYLVNKRNQIAKAKVPGPIDGSYMQTESRVPIVTDEFYLNGNYAFLMRGLWYTENYFLGGPFVSISVLDKKNDRVICLDAYVYAGKQNKKLYVWQVESILRTMKILD